MNRGHVFSLAGYKSSDVYSFGLSPPPSTAATMTDRHRQAYKYVLLQIAQNLGREHVKKLGRFYTGLTPLHDTEPLNFFRCLEHEGRISWEDVDFLKDLMRKIRRFDFVKKLTEFEVKRDLAILLDFYARKRQGLDLSCCSVAVKKVAGCLGRLTEIVRDRLDVAKIIISVESSKDIRSELVYFEEEMDCREQNFSWNEFMILVVFAGELLAIASASESCSEPVMELCSTAADELCSRMIELGSWVSYTSSNLALSCLPFFVVEDNTVSYLSLYYVSTVSVNALS